MTAPKETPGGGLALGTTTENSCVSKSTPVPCESNPLPTLAPADLRVAFTKFTNLSATEAILRTVSWAEVVALLENPPEHGSKHACPLFKLARFGSLRTEKNSLRHDANLIEVHGIEADYDGEKVSVDAAANMLAEQGIEAVIYTSASHSDEYPRWRVVLPLSAPCAPGERAIYVAMLNDVLGGILAPESFTATQSYFYGRVRGAPYRVKHVTGLPLDLMRMVLVERYPEKVSAARVREAIDPDIDRQIVLGGVNEEVLRDLESALLEGLAAWRADDRKAWMDVLHALKSIEQAGYPDEALRLAHLFSARCEAQYNPEKFEITWGGINANRITYKSIFKWATDDGWINPKSRTAPKTAGEYALLEDRTDTGNANILVRIADGNLRYVPERRLWLWWEGHRWLADMHGVEANTAAGRVAQYYHTTAVGLARQSENQALDGAEGKRLAAAADSVAKWSKSCRNKPSIDRMLALAAKDSRVQLPAEKMDRDPWLLGVDNGVVDLRTGELRSAAREDYVTKRSPFGFDPTARAPRWVRFIDEITGVSDGKGGYRSRKALASYLQKALGYSLTGSTSEHKLFVCIGAGSNGKNILLDTFQDVGGGYAQTIPPEALMVTRYDGDAERPSPTAAILAGARAAISSESKDGARLDVALVKRHTGGGYLTARLLRENTFRFEITHKLWLMTNHRPAVDHLDDAMRGRLHLIPFDRRWNRPGHPERDPALPDGDKDLMTKLRAEGEGVLAWLVEGAVRYTKEGLEPPGEVARMTREYFRDQDALGRWIEQYEKCDPRDGTGAGDLFGAFEAWCVEEEIEKWHPSNSTAFSSAMRARGVEKRKAKDGARYGLRVKPVSELDRVTGDGL